MQGQSLGSQAWKQVSLTPNTVLAQVVILSVSSAGLPQAAQHPDPLAYSPALSAIINFMPRTQHCSCSIVSIPSVVFAPSLRFLDSVQKPRHSSQDPRTERPSPLSSLKQLELLGCSEGSQDTPGTPETPRVITGVAHSYSPVNSRALSFLV